MAEANLITRKQVADMLGVSPWVVWRHEAEWGLRLARRDFNRHEIRYVREMVLTILRNRGWIH